ncbi:hypothetical protein D3C85_1782440 [compost metagenome]
MLIEFASKAVLVVFEKVLVSLFILRKNVPTEFLQVRVAGHGLLHVTDHLVDKVTGGRVGKRLVLTQQHSQLPI